MARADKHIVDRIFEEGLQEARMAPPASAWENIASEMEKDLLRRKIAFTRMMAAASILLFLSAGGWLALSYLSPANGPTRISSKVISLPFEESQRPNIKAETHKAMLAGDDAAASDAVEHASQPAIQGPKDGLRNSLRFAFEDKMSGVRTSVPSIPVSLVGDGKAERAGIRKMEDLPAIPDQGAFLEEAPDMLHTDMQKPDQELKPNPQLEQRFRMNNGIAEGKPDEERKRQKRSWTLGGAFSPDFAFASQTPVQSEFSAAKAGRTQLNDPKSADKTPLTPTTAYSTGVRANLHLNKRLALQTGLMYSTRSTSTNTTYENFGEDQNFENNFNLNSLELPLMLKYNLIHGKRLDYYLASGVSANLFVNYNQYLQNANGEINAREVSSESEALLPSQANLLLATGVQYRFLDKLSLNFEPGLRYGFFTTEYAFSQTDPLSISLVSGINYHF